MGAWWVTPSPCSLLCDGSTNSGNHQAQPNYWGFLLVLTDLGYGPADRLQGDEQWIDLARVTLLKAQEDQSEALPIFRISTGRSGVGFAAWCLRKDGSGTSSHHREWSSSMDELAAFLNELHSYGFHIDARQIAAATRVFFDTATAGSVGGKSTPSEVSNGPNYCEVSGGTI